MKERAAISHDKPGIIYAEAVNNLNQEARGLMLPSESHCVATVDQSILQNQPLYKS
jgi:hypothetical protein